MEFVKMHRVAQAVAEATAKGRHVDLSYRKALEDAKKVPFLDQQNTAVYVQYPDMISPTWEHYEHVDVSEVGINGELKIEVQGQDADGDWLTVRIVTWPRGTWLKVDSTIIAVPNPFYEAPEPEDASDPENAEPGNA